MKLVQEKKDRLRSLIQEALDDGCHPSQLESRLPAPWAKYIPTVVNEYWPRLSASHWEEEKELHSIPVSHKHKATLLVVQVREVHYQYGAREVNDYFNLTGNRFDIQVNDERFENVGRNMEEAIIIGLTYISDPDRNWTRAVTLGSAYALGSSIYHPVVMG